MDPINILVAINLFVSMSANISGAKKGMKSKLSNVVKKPKTYLQKVPPNIYAIVLLLTIAAIFNFGVFSEETKNQYMSLRIIGVVIFIAFSWLQVVTYKSLGEYYSQDIIIFKGHQLRTTGYYKIVRHPQYLSQILSDLGVGLALMGYIIIPLVLLVEVPLFILRAKLEDDILAAHFKEKFDVYKKNTGFLIPFIG